MLLSPIGYSGRDPSISCASRISFSYCTGIGSFRFRRLLTGPGSFARVAIVDRRGVGLSDRLSPQDLRLVTFNASGHLYWVDDNGVATSPVIS